MKRKIAESVVVLIIIIGTGQLELCIIRIADCAFVLALRPVLEEHWRAGGACLRPNAPSPQPTPFELGT